MISRNMERKIENALSFTQSARNSSAPSTTSELASVNCEINSGVKGATMRHDAVSSEIRQRPERRKQLRFWFLTRDRENCERIKVNRMESEGAGKMERGSLYLISLIVCSSFNLTPFRSSAGASIYLSVNIGILIEHRGINEGSQLCD